MCACAYIMYYNVCRFFRFLLFKEISVDNYMKIIKYYC